MQLSLPSVHFLPTRCYAGLVLGTAWLLGVGWFLADRLHSTSNLTQTSQAKIELLLLSVYFSIMSTGDLWKTCLETVSESRVIIS